MLPPVHRFNIRIWLKKPSGCFFFVQVFPVKYPGLPPLITLLFVCKYAQASAVLAIDPRRKQGLPCFVTAGGLIGPGGFEGQGLGKGGGVDHQPDGQPV